MADEPVSAWREPWRGGPRRWATRNRTAVTARGGGAGGRRGRAGGGAGRADAGQRRSCPVAGRETAPTGLAAANAELTRSKAAVQARYDLAVEAIKTFHTGVSEDFLLKQEQFKELRDRLLKSAADFYGKLGALLGKETDLASRRALAQAELRAGRPDRQGRPQGGRAGGAPGGAGGARGAGGRAGGRPRGDGRRRPQPDRRRGPPGSDGQDRRGRGDLPPGRGAAGGPGGPARRLGAGRAGGLPVAAGLSPVTRRAGPPTPWRPTAWRGPTRRRWPPAPGRRTRPGATWRTRSTASASCCTGYGQAAEAEAEYRQALAIYQKLADDNPAVSEFRSGLADSHINLGILLSETGKPTEAEAEYRTGAGDPAEAGRRQPRRHRFPQQPGGQPQQPRLSAVADGQAGGGGGRVPHGAGDPAEAGRRQPRRHRVPQQPGGHPRQPRHPAVGRRASERRRRPSTATALAIQQKLADDNPAVTDFRSAWRSTTTTSAILLSQTGQAGGGGGRVPHGAGDLAEAGR